MIIVSNKYILLTWLKPSEWPEMLEATDRDSRDEPYWIGRWVYDRFDERFRMLYIRVAGLEASIIL